MSKKDKSKSRSKFDIKSNKVADKFADLKETKEIERTGKRQRIEVPLDPESDVSDSSTPKLSKKRPKSRSKSRGRNQEEGDGKS